MELWIARDRDGELRLYYERPTRFEEVFDYSEYWKTVFKNSLSVDSEMFPDLKWEDEPRQVELIYKYEY